MNIFESIITNGQSIKESDLSYDLSEYQKWVDYDMKRYHRISKITQDKLDEAGLEVVKDDHGDYEVIAKYDESLKESVGRVLIGYDELEDYLSAHSAHGSRFYCTINTDYTGWDIVDGQNDYSLSEVMSNLRAKYPHVKKFRIDPKEPNILTAKTTGKSEFNPSGRERQTIFINILDYKK